MSNNYTPLHQAQTRVLTVHDIVAANDNTEKFHQPFQPGRKSLIERLDGKLIIEPGTHCWVWVGAHNGNSYGRIWFDGKMYYTHRFAFELFVGNIPNGMEIDHLCSNPACLNPLHLEPVTHAENMARGKRAQRTRCIRDHPYDEGNTYFHPDGSRVCRICKRMNHRAWKQRQRNETAPGGLVLPRA